MSSSSRAVSPVIANILMVAIVVILAATISVFALGFTDEANQPGPVVGQSSGELVTQDGFDGGIVRITHIAGDPISVENIEIVVDARDACGKTARIINLPSDSRGFANVANFGDENFEAGDDSIISQGTLQSNWDIGVLHKTNNNVFTAGTSLEFRLTGGTDPDDCTINSGDEVVVRVVHTPTNSVVIKETLTAT